MSAEVFNIAFGVFLQAGMDYATCARKAQQIVDAVTPKDVQSPSVETAACAPEYDVTAPANDAPRGVSETQLDFILRVCNGQWRTRDWIAERIGSQSKVESTIRSCNKLIQDGRLKRCGSRRNPSYLSAGSLAGGQASFVQAELPVATRNVGQDEDTHQRDNETQPEFLLRVCSDRWRSLEWLARRIITKSSYPKGPASAACNKLIVAGRMESKGTIGSVCYRTKVTP